MLVLSYNPGYQSIVKDLKQSTKQRFASLVFDHPSVELETEIIRTETGLDDELCAGLAEMGAKIRELQGFGLEEGVSSRLLVYVGQLISQGLDPVDAATHAIAQTLTDDVEVRGSIVDIIRLYFGELAEIADVESERTRG
jgi:nitric oxide reductase NorQ protein